MASVFKAYEASLDRHVALKVLPTEFLHDATFAERFQREAQIVAKLEHPSIVPVYSFGISDGVPWMAMKLVSGGSLAAAIKGSALGAEKLLPILGRVADALDYAHARGVIHRDVKPQNILLTDEAHSFLADFGVAQMLEGTPGRTATGVILGTPEYMAPEQARGSKLDGRCDTYALGIVAFECLTGRVPFEADTPVAVLMKHQTDPVPAPPPKTLSAAGVRVLMKALAKRPEDRWATSAEFVKELTRAIASSIPETSLVVLGGSLKGRRYTLVPGDTLIGSDPTCQVSVPLPGVSPVHARVHVGPSGLRVQDARSPRGVFVNDDRVQGETPVREGDILWLGPPGEAESVMLSVSVSRGEAAADPVIEEFVIDEGGVESVVESAPAAFNDDVFYVPEEAAPPPAPIEEFFVADAAPEAPSEDVFFVEEAPAPAPVAPPPAPAPAPSTLIMDPELESAPLMFDEPEPPVLEPAPPLFQPPAPPAPPVVVERQAPTLVAAPLDLELAPAPVAPPPAQKPEAPAPRSVEPPAPFHAPSPTPSAASSPRVRPTTTPVPTPSLTPARSAPSPRPAARRAEPPPPARPKPRTEERAPSSSGGPPKALLFGGGGIVLLALVFGGISLVKGLSPPTLESLAPDRAKIGQTVVLSGRHLGGTAAADAVYFGERRGNVVSATPARIEVQVPVFPVLPGRDSKVDVTVDVGGHRTNALSLAVYAAPRVDGLSPDVAMPGEEIELAGAGWDPQATVRFGDVPAEITSNAPNMIRVRVPPLDTNPDTEVQVVVASGVEQSNPAPFHVGRLPIVGKVDPHTVSPGDVVTVNGRGFKSRQGANTVKIGGVRAYVLQATDTELKAVVPFVAAEGEVPVEVRVSGLENAGQATLQASAPPGDVVDLRFIVEPFPFEDSGDHDHAVLATELGPAFVISASGGRTAAERAQEAATALNQSAGPLKASLDADFTVHGTSLVLVGKTTPILEATAEDAQAYAEDWTKAGARGRAVSPARLAAWWNAVARDLVLLLVRGQKPQFAQALAPEGRVLGDIYQAAHKTGRFGVPRSILKEAKPPFPDQMRLLAFRLPAGVPEAISSEGGGGPPALSLQGVWRGTELARGEKKYMQFTFAGKEGTCFYAGLTMDVLETEFPSKDTVHFALPIQGRRYYWGTWDGRRITGTVYAEPGGKNSIGTFELVPGQ
jgi:serine/threonine-protein kinase